MDCVFIDKFIGGTLVRWVEAKVDTQHHREESRDCSTNERSPGVDRTTKSREWVREEGVTTMDSIK